jgi:iron complex transport system ATP-binding protein
MGALVEQGFAVTTGAFPANDPDAETARALGVTAVTAPPFSSLDATVEEHAALVRRAAALVIAPVPVGPLNRQHAQIIADSAMPPNRIVIIDPGGVAARDFVDGEWARRVAGMIEEGAGVATDAPEAAGLVAEVLAKSARS